MLPPRAAARRPPSLPPRRRPTPPAHPPRRAAAPCPPPPPAPARSRAATNRRRPPRPVRLQAPARLDGRLRRRSFGCPWRRFSEDREVRRPAEELLRGVGHLELAASRAPEHDLFAGLHPEFLGQRLGVVGLLPHHAGHRLDRLVSEQRLRPLQADGALDILQRRGLQLLQHERRRVGRGRASGSASAPGSIDESSATAPSTPGAAAPAAVDRRATSSRASWSRASSLLRSSDSRVLSQRSASSNRCSRSLMSASALRAMTFSPSRARTWVNAVSADGRSPRSRWHRPSTMLAGI